MTSSVWFIASVSKPRVVDGGRGQADAVDGDRVAEADLGAERGGDAQAGAVGARARRDSTVPTSWISPVNITTP